MLRTVFSVAALALVAGSANAQHWGQYPGGRDWPQVDCGKSLFQVPGQKLCREGPIGEPRGLAVAPVCHAEQWFIYAQMPSSRAEVNGAARTDPPCWVIDYPDPVAALNAFRVVREGSAGSKLTGAAGLLPWNFTAKTGESCGAFVRYGPPIEDGHAYQLRGYICAGKGSSLSGVEITNFVNAIVVKSR